MGQKLCTSINHSTQKLVPPLSSQTVETSEILYELKKKTRNKENPTNFERKKKKEIDLKQVYRT